MCSGSRCALPKGTATVNAPPQQPHFQHLLFRHGVNEFLGERHANTRAFVRPTLAVLDAMETLEHAVCRQYVARSALDSKELPWF
jgi:hypothetical protein